MPWIENVSYDDIIKGNHKFEFGNTILIQIVDPCIPIPEPTVEFNSRHWFEFCDSEDYDVNVIEDFKIQENHAEELVNILKNALKNDDNIVVHCIAGQCRSGAVVEVGTIMGFDDTGKYRLPTLRVKRMMLEQLGMSYN